MEEVRGGVVNEPEVPVPPPIEVHEVLSVDDQLTAAVAPFAMVDGVAITVTVGLAVCDDPAVVGLAVCEDPPLCKVVDPFPPPHEARPVTANSTAKIIFASTRDPTVKLFNMIVFLQ